MSIRTYFENIATAIKEKNPNVATVTPAQMPDAILAIPSGGQGIQTISASDWDALTPSQKQQYGVIAVITSTAGYERGYVVSGEDYSLLVIHQSYLNGGSYNYDNSTLTFELSNVGQYSGLVLDVNDDVSNITIELLENNTTVEVGVCNLSGSLPSLIQSGANRVSYRDFMNTATGSFNYTSFNRSTMRLYFTSYTTANVSYKVRITLGGS